MPFCMRALLLIAVSLLLAPCNAQSGANATYYLDANCSSACSNCTVSNPIITAGGCVQERNDVNSSSITTACNASHVMGTPLRRAHPSFPSHAACLPAGLSFITSNCSGAPLPFAYAVEHLPPRHIQQRDPSRLLLRPNRVSRSANIRFAGPKAVLFGSQTVRFLPSQWRATLTSFSRQRLTVTGSNFAVSPSFNCTAASACCHLLPSLLLLTACVPLPPPSKLSLDSHRAPHFLFSACLTPDCFTSRCLQLRLFGSAFALSIAFSNLAALELALVNMSVVVPPILQACCRNACDATHILHRN